MTLVFDNNVLISAALFWNSNPSKSLRKARQNKNTILSSQFTSSELRLKLLSSKFDKYISFANRIDFCETLARESQWIKPMERIFVCRDIKDNMFLELAVAGKADLIITGDSDLLILHPFRGIPVITPKVFIDQY
ncbi:MAG: putative toxin-antitoxin system toxin component, PIN family [Bacteroidetes bacterium]|jgi:putative PIN family toxin of toxin-antitoxin system|nr:putative toxin-antitoxin system toxin component, PIN family [Bacteroidota bacterium]